MEQEILSILHVCAQATTEQELLPHAQKLSKLASSADDDALTHFAKHTRVFVWWLNADGPALRAYAACSLANIAFTPQGQKATLEAGGVEKLVELLRMRDQDRKVLQHVAAALQNATYQCNPACAAVIASGGDKVLKKLASKQSNTSEYAMGTLDNLECFQRETRDSKKTKPSVMLKLKGTLQAATKLRRGSISAPQTSAGLEREVAPAPAPEVTREATEEAAQPAPAAPAAAAPAEEAEEEAAEPAVAAAALAVDEKGASTSLIAERRQVDDEAAAMRARIAALEKAARGGAQQLASSRPSTRRRLEHGAHCNPA